MFINLFKIFFNKQFVLSILPIFASLLLIKAIPLVDHFFVGTINNVSIVYLYSYMAYIHFFLSPFSRAIGYPLVVTLNKDKEQSASTFFSGLYFVIIIYLIFLGLSFTFKENFFNIINIQNTSENTRYFSINVIISFMMLISSYLNFALIAMRKNKELLFSYLLVLFLNFLGNFLAITFSDQPIGKLQLIGIATIISVFIQLSVQMRIIWIEIKGHKPFLIAAIPHKKNLLNFIINAKDMFLSQFLVIINATFLPMIFSLAILKNGEIVFSSIFNMSDRMLQFFLVPIIASRTSGLAWLKAKRSENFSLKFLFQCYYSNTLGMSALSLVLLLITPKFVMDELLVSNLNPEMLLAIKMLGMIILLDGIIYPIYGILDLCGQSQINSKSSMILTISTLVASLFIFLQKSPINNYSYYILLYSAPYLLSGTYLIRKFLQSSKKPEFGN